MSKPVSGLEMAKYLNEKLGDSGLALSIVSLFPKFPNNKQEVMALVYAAAEGCSKSQINMVVKGLFGSAKTEDPAMLRLALSSLWHMAGVSEPAAYLEHFPSAFRKDETAKLEPVAVASEKPPFDPNDFEEIV